MDEDSISRIVIAKNYIAQVFQQNAGGEELQRIMQQLELFIDKNCQHQFIQDEIEIVNNVDDPVMQQVSYCAVCGRGGKSPPKVTRTG
jgi:hypothetical protein